MANGRDYWFQFDQVLRPNEMIFEGSY